ncbi:uncharacterized protein BDW47DRAFT_103405 [Aspergillus candidus]|uniref:Secreted peptide n=1 Tax=Aspergillus candidus TaxID=41067 RepID=A0A2I2FFA1_ASPCN|nr:hypothetical protein BDW47DRAFT_103405 [Aspergillus candidus]PLB39294.1 hypothetical protein BDW47DRAFT_103405 [Aspergillus candidus]
MFIFFLFSLFCCLPFCLFSCASHHSSVDTSFICIYICWRWFGFRILHCIGFVCWACLSTCMSGFLHFTFVLFF